MKKILIIIGILALAGGGAVLALYAQVWNPLWNPFRPSPEVVLTEMILEMGKLKTVHSEMDFSITNKEEEGSVSVKLVGDTDQRDPENLKSKGVFNMNLLNQESEASAAMEFITIDQIYYLKLTEIPDLPSFNYLGLELSSLVSLIEDEWIKIDKESIDDLLESFGETSSYSFSEQDQEEMATKIIDLIKGKKFYRVKQELPDVKMGDKVLYHYLLSLDSEEIKNFSPEIMKIIIDYYFGEEMSAWERELKDKQMEAMEEELPDKIDEFFEKVGEIDFEVWIGQRDKYLYRVKFEKELDLAQFSEVPSGIDPGMVLFAGEINFSRFNESVEIKEPSDFKTLENIFQLMMSQLLTEMMQEEPKEEASLRLISPKGGEVACIGEDFIIEWDSEGVSAVSIWLEEEAYNHPAYFIDSVQATRNEMNEEGKGVYVWKAGWAAEEFQEEGEVYRITIYGDYLIGSMSILEDTSGLFTLINCEG